MSSIAFVVISLFLHVYGIEHIHGNILNLLNILP